MPSNPGEVKVWEENVIFPTYGVGEPDKNPMFFERRVYQGSSGKVYPYPVTEKILDEKMDKTYKGVWMENDYIRVLILPELGGRIHRAYDKTNGYDFVYYNEVIKPALVGLLGPWISGGIEFNWPQHHRPTTFAPVDYVSRMNGDGSGTVSVSEVDQMYGSKGMASFTLYPGKAYIEIKGRLYNRTPLPQTFLWWANPAVPANENTQSIFPPDVRAVMDHGKRDVSRFPMATGVYYKHDYGAGVDISRFKNIPVPTSYMAYKSAYDFVGGYDHARGAGILHVADHRVSPGKKQWTWGCGNFGQAWDRNLTDENGPYIELMTGVYTDNQPDFTWLAPFEEKTFTQYFMPYKLAADVKNASPELLLNLRLETDRAHICVYATEKFEGVRVKLSNGDKIFFDETRAVSPTDVLSAETAVPAHGRDGLVLAVFARDGRLMLEYSPRPEKIEPLPEPAQPASNPETIATCEELYLTGLHLEQYRHATYEPDAYYLEGLKRDPGDSRLNTAYGMLLLRRGRFADAEKYFRVAIKRLTWKNPNPCDGEPFCCLGLALLYRDKPAEAFDAFYKATWTNAEQEMSFYWMSAISRRLGKPSEALGFAERSLIKNSRNMKSRALYAALLAETGQTGEAVRHLEETLSIDPFCYTARLLLTKISGKGMEETMTLMNGRPSSFIEAAIDFAEAGFYEDAAEALRFCRAAHPMLKYHEAYCLHMAGDETGAISALKEAADRSPDHCFPNRLEDIAALEYAIRADKSDARARYYLGCLWYDKKQYALAREMWEESSRLDGNFPTVWRNLALLYYNKANEKAKAAEAMERAFSLDTSDARVFMELDTLRKKMSIPADSRLAQFEKYRGTFERRDDLYAEYVTLLNTLGRHGEALDLLMKRKFHPWEGGEGKVTRQYVTALTQIARESLERGDPAAAKRMTIDALTFPNNLGEGKLEGARDSDVYYYMGLADKALGKEDAAQDAFGRATEGGGEPAGMMYYNDLPPDSLFYQGLAWLELGLEGNAGACFYKLVDYGERHFFDEARIDYFAVSLPDLQIFDDDLAERNKIHCLYLLAMGHYGLKNREKAEKFTDDVLKKDPSHQGAALLRKLFVSGK
ncbi:MAG: DUF5107 domain-containing protein [Synergistaceae bacterium]|jgi:tetratricopeptide (TPR) repeat protein|nr:DUF5107 domain-containing protein [Synergistaceae bacterium]